jgi:hypothetical protein
MEFNPELEYFLNESWDKSGLSADAAKAEASTHNINKFFEDLETQCAIGDHGPAPVISPRRNLGDEKDWDVWFSAEAHDCPPEGAGCYKRAGGRLVKVK